MRVLVLGGTRFFGKRLVQSLVRTGERVEIATRQRADTVFSPQVPSHFVERSDLQTFKKSLGHISDWDVVFDQICYSSRDAELTCKFFEGRTKHYVMTSTMSVYNYGTDLSEDAIDP